MALMSFSLTALNTRQEGCNVFKFLKESESESKIMYLANLIFKCGRKMIPSLKVTQRCIITGENERIKCLKF
jgi:hypothetical protein